MNNKDRVALPRRGLLGLRFAESPANDGVIVTELTLPAGAKAQGVCVGDVLLSADGYAFDNISVFRAWSAGVKAGVSVRLSVQRGAQLLSLEVIPQPAPIETAEGVRSHYGQASLSDGTRLRTIITESTGGVSKAVVFVLPGYSLTSCEWAQHPDFSLRRWVQDVALAGYKVLRVERRSCGESDRCLDAQGAIIDPGFDREVQDWIQVHSELSREGELRDLPWVLYGYSLGGLQAPLVAPQIGAAAIAVWGSGCDTWSEYSDALLRRRMRFAAMRESDIERAVRAQQRLFASVLLGGHSLADWHSKDTAARAFASWLGVTENEQIHGRSVDYWRGVYCCPCADPLAQWDRPMLVLRGESDCVTFAHEHEQIAKMARMGEYVSIPGVDHDYTQHASMEAAYQKTTLGEYSPLPASVFTRWLDRVLTR